MVLKVLLLTTLLILLRKQIHSNAYTESDIKQGTSTGNPSCLYEDTINITDSFILKNGSYWYNNQTLIPPHLVHTYNYEIFYNGTNHTVASHKRACFCQLHPCITLCSDSIIQTYYEFIENERYDLLYLFNISVTQSNGDIVEKNIINDFQHNILNEFCDSKYPLSPEKDVNLYSWTFFENGTLLRHKDKVLMKRTAYCFDIYFENDGDDTYPLLNPMNCAKRRKNLEIMEEVNYWIQVFSIIFCALTFCVYFQLPGFLNLQGKCFLTYLFSLTLSYGIFSFINLTQIILNEMPCLLLGYLNQFLQLSHYTWLGITCYNTWKTFKVVGYEASYKKYAKIGYSLPLLITLISWFAQQVIIDEEMKPGISESRCGLDVSQWKAALYLYGYCLIVLILCLVFYILTFNKIKKESKEGNEIRVVHDDEKDKLKFRNYIIYFRLFIIMGLSWFLDVLSFVLQVTQHQKISSAVDYINSLQGFYIFINLIARQEVQQQIHKKFRPKKLNKIESNIHIKLLHRRQSS